jgi:hypothetical protein
LLAGIQGRRVFSLVILLVATIWPAIYNSGPFYYYDTVPYIRRADAAVNRLTGLQTSWTRQENLNSSKAAPFDTESAAGHRSTQPPQGSKPAPKGGVLYLGRSIYYGLLLYLGTADQYFWLSILLQGAAVISALWLLLRLQNIPVWPAIFLVGLPLCFVSDVSFFVSFLMPDLFAGIAILVCAALFAAELPVRALEAVAAWFLLSASLLFHDSIPVIVTLMAISYFGCKAAQWSRIDWQKERVIFGILLLAFITSAAGRSVYVRVAEHATGLKPIRLPFLSAHLIEGPGSIYLHSTCPGSGFALCAFVDQFPENSDVFLWSQHGGFTATYVSPETREKMSAQDLKFALTVFRDSPTRFFGFFSQEILHEIVNLQLSDFLYDPDSKKHFDFYLPSRPRAAVQQSPAYTGSIPIDAFALLNYVFVGVALVFLAWRLAIRNRVSTQNTQKWKLTAWLILGVLFNAMICGAISGPLSRYMSRAVWLLPLAALLFVADNVAKRMNARKGNIAVETAA